MKSSVYIRTLVCFITVVNVWPGFAFISVSMGQLNFVTICLKVWGHVHHDRGF